MKKTITEILAAVFLILILSVSVFAQSLNVEDLSKKISGKEVPGSLSLFFGNAEVELQVNMENGEKTMVGIVTEKNKVQKVVKGEVKNPSLRLFTSEKTIKEISTSENTFTALKKALDNGEISYKGVGFKNKVKFSFVSMLSSIVRTLTGSGIEPVKEIKAEVKNENKSGTGLVTGSAVKVVEEKKDAAEKRVDEKAVEEEKPAEEDVSEEAVEEEPVVEETGPKTYLVKLIEGGFDQTELRIKVGDKVTWENQRSGRFDKGLVVGVQKCAKIKSPLFRAGESFSWTFDKAQTCVIVDGIFTTVTMKIMVE